MSTLFPYTTLFRSHDTRRAAWPRCDAALDARRPPLCAHRRRRCGTVPHVTPDGRALRWRSGHACPDRKSTRLNSSHLGISYAVFCLKKKNSELTRLVRSGTETTSADEDWTIKVDVDRLEPSTTY